MRRERWQEEEKHETKLIGTVFGGVQLLDKYLQLRQADQILRLRLHQLKLLWELQETCLQPEACAEWVKKANFFWTGAQSATQCYSAPATAIMYAELVSHIAPRCINGALALVSRVTFSTRPSM